MIPKEILNKYNMQTLEEYKKTFGDSKESEMSFYETFLIQTDHIPLKIIERLVEDLAGATLFNILEVLFNFISAIKVEYREVLQYRKQAREMINKLNATEKST